MGERVTMTDLGIRLRELRTGTGLGLRAISDMTGVSAATISRAERGGDLMVSHLIALADFYDASLDDIAGRGSGRP